MSLPVLQRVLRLARRDFEDVDVPFSDDDLDGLQLRAPPRDAAPAGLAEAARATPRDRERLQPPPGRKTVASTASPLFEFLGAAMTDLPKSLEARVQQYLKELAAERSQ